MLSFNQSDINRLFSELETAEKIVITTHFKPDGDAMGSQIGMKQLLMENFPEKTVYAVGDEPRFFSFMEGSVMDTIPDECYNGALAIILDCGSAHLISDDRYLQAKALCRIDHHLFCGQIAPVEVVDSTFESCCGLIAELARANGLRLTPLAAKSLYTGMVTDSGRFRYDGTTARTHALASWLMEQEFDTNEIFRNLYADSYENKKLKAQFILKIQFTPANTAYIYTTREEFDTFGADLFTISRGMTNTMADMDYEAYDAAIAWMEEHGDEEV